MAGLEDVACTVDDAHRDIGRGGPVIVARHRDGNVIRAIPLELRSQRGLCGGSTFPDLLEADLLVIDGHAVGRIGDSIRRVIVACLGSAPSAISILGVGESIIASDGAIVIPGARGLLRRRLGGDRLIGDGVAGGGVRIQRIHATDELELCLLVGSKVAVLLGAIVEIGNKVKRILARPDFRCDRIGIGRIENGVAEIPSDCSITEAGRREVLKRKGVAICIGLRISKVVSLAIDKGCCRHASEMVGDADIRDGLLLRDIVEDISEDRAQLRGAGGCLVVALEIVAFAQAGVALRIGIVAGDGLHILVDAAGTPGRRVRRGIGTTQDADGIDGRALALEVASRADRTVGNLLIKATGMVGLAIREEDDVLLGARTGRIRIELALGKAHAVICACGASGTQV